MSIIIDTKKDMAMVACEGCGEVVTLDSAEVQGELTKQSVMDRLSQCDWVHYGLDLHECGDCADEALIGGGNV